MPGVFDAMQRFRKKAYDSALADPYSEPSLLKQQNDQQVRERSYGNTASDAYLTRAKNFDAQQGLNTYARGAYNTISSALKDELRSLGGEAVGAGRLNTGFYDADQGRVVNRATQQLADTIAQGALTAQGQQLQNDEGLADFGYRNQSDANDLLLARRQELIDQANQRRRKKRGIGAAIGSVLGAAAGFIPGFGEAIGGPMGGYELGGGIGGAIG